MRYLFVITCYTMKNKFLYILILALCLCGVSAQNVTLKKISLLEKLPVSAIHRVFQDREGYLWYGTINGLCRDDGYNLKIFRSENTDLMASSHITAIREDKRGNIWFGTLKGAYILDKKTYDIRPLDESRYGGNKILEISATSDGCMWVCISGKLFRYDANGALAKEYCLNVNTRFRSIHNIIEDREGNTLVSFWRNGIYKLNKERDSLELFAKPNPAYADIEETFILQDKDKPYFWVGTWDRGIVRFDPSVAEDSMYVFQELPVNSKNEADEGVLYMIQDDVYGYLWVTSFTDLFVFEITQDGMLKQVNTSSFLPQCNKMLNEIIKDKDGNLWVAAYDQNSFTVNFQNNTMREYPVEPLRDFVNGNPAITSVCKDDNGVFWLAQERIGLCLYSPERNIVKNLKSESPVVQNLMQGQGSISQIQRSRKAGRVWVAAYSPDIYGFTQSNLEVKVTDIIRLTDVDDAAAAVEYLYEDTGNNLWIGTMDGLYIYKTTSGELEKIKEVSDIVSGITETTDGAIWLATENDGLYQIKHSKEVTSYPVDKELLCIDATPDGKLWLGTGEGLVLLFNPEDRSIEDYSAASGMNGDMVSKILVDMYNHIWIYTNQKLTEFNPRNGSFRNYLASDEWMLLNRFLPRSAFKDPSGALYFGGIPGFMSFEPTHNLESIPQQVETAITDVEVAGSSLLPNLLSDESGINTLKISPYSQNIAIYFSSFNHSDAIKIRYAYRLKGVDNDWVYVGDGKNSAFYNYLSKGRYVFEVKATDENGLWSNNVTRMNIVRLPAFYETWWAYSLYVLLIILIICGGLYVYLRWLKHENEKVLMRKIAQIKISSLDFKPADEQLLNKALRIVEENLSEPDFDVEVLAEQLNMSRSTLSRKIKTASGLTPLEFIRNIRMKHAGQMLVNKSASITEVATMLGYNDRRYFAACFKEEFGITPSEYQKRNSNIKV